ncbi:MAG: hypothetical protein K2X50_09980 [Gammaproteobacteria bacterium]|nr:hypothetical protein [Gammaproteobacteria bacterium]
MRSRGFKKYLEKRLDKGEIAEIEKSANLEAQYIKSLQEDISGAVTFYMKEENIGFNELVRRLQISPTQASRIKSGGANLTLATIAHVFALFRIQPHFVIGKIVRKNRHSEI